MFYSLIREVALSRLSREIVLERNSGIGLLRLAQEEGHI